MRDDEEPGTVRSAVQAQLAPLFKEARLSGKWFHCAYQNLWFSPEELEREHRNGKFFWGSVNWTLRDPMELLDAAKLRAEEAANEVLRLQKRLDECRATQSVRRTA